MEIGEFAEITYRVLEGTRFEDYIPTLCLPGQDAIHGLQGIPPEEENNLREISIEWAINSTDEHEEFLVAFRDGPAHFRIVRRFEGETREALFPAVRAKQAPGGE
jgi:hypothetical protein